ncbi:MAG: 50S ribosomal protein L11 methyltransferase [Moorellaceae bacterium]
MKWQEISITIAEEAGEAAADIFYAVGAQGLIIEDERSPLIIRGYLPQDALWPDRWEKLKEGLNRLGRYFPDCLVGLSCKTVKEEDWANAWKAYYKPVRIGSRLVVKPSWENYVPGSGEIIIELDPGMAFGTGTHATTAMALEMLEKWLEPGATVYDVGTGSGIIAIAAALLGAGRVVAIDNDPVALKAAQENVERNGVADKVKVQQGDLLRGVKDLADLVVANIVADVLLVLLPQASRVLRPGGHIILGGIISPRSPEMRAALKAEGFTLRAQKVQGDWVTLVARKG